MDIDASSDKLDFWRLIFIISLQYQCNLHRLNTETDSWKMTCLQYKCEESHYIINVNYKGQAVKWHMQLDRHQNISSMQA